MKFSTQLIFVGLSISTQAVASPNQARALQLLQMFSHPYDFLHRNASSLQMNTNASLTTDPNLVCEAQGTSPLPLDSCRQAIESIADDPTEFTMGPRGQGNFAVKIPWQVLSRESYSISKPGLACRISSSSKEALDDALFPLPSLTVLGPLTADGLCSLKVVAPPTQFVKTPSDTTSLSDLKKGFLAIFRSCAVPPNNGGYLKKQGKPSQPLRIQPESKPPRYPQ